MKDDIKKFSIKNFYLWIAYDSKGEEWFGYFKNPIQDEKGDWWYLKDPTIYSDYPYICLFSILNVKEVFPSIANKVGPHKIFCQISTNQERAIFKIERRQRNDKSYYTEITPADDVSNVSTEVEDYTVDESIQSPFIGLERGTSYYISLVLV